MKAEKFVDQSVETLSKGITELRDRSANLKSVAIDVAEKSRAVFDDVREQLPEGSERIIGLVAAGAAIGVASYLAGRRQGSRPAVAVTRLTKSGEPTAERTSRNLTSDLEPVFKFVKLWMLYRAAM